VDLRGLHRPSSPRVRSGIRPAHVVGPRGSRAAGTTRTPRRATTEEEALVFFFGSNRAALCRADVG
jgi:hypothetical protein